MSRRQWFTLATVAVLVLALAGGGLTWWVNGRQPDQEPAPGVTAALTAGGISGPLKLGVLVSLTSSPGEGGDWRDAAEGAQVAAKRFAMSGVDVQLLPMNDRGTADGARAAVDQLARDGAVGVIIATSGDHVTAAVETAQTNRLPALLPYATDPAVLKGSAWLTGPTKDEFSKAFQTMVRSMNSVRPLVITTPGGSVPDSLVAAQQLSFEPGADPVKLAEDVRNRVTAPDGGVDAVFVAGAAEQQATVVRALQGAKVTVPTFVTPEATSPAFGPALVRAGGSLAGNLGTVGPNWGDPVALQSDPDGKAMSAYLAAVRNIAADPKSVTLFGDRPFTEVANKTDVRSHDAVVAFVRAAELTQDAKPDQLSAALPLLSLNSDRGLAGFDLNFTNPAAMRGDTVVRLQSSDQDLGLRPTSAQAEPTLYWFAAPPR